MFSQEFSVEINKKRLTCAVNRFIIIKLYFKSDIIVPAYALRLIPLAASFAMISSTVGWISVLARVLSLEEK